MRMPQMKSAQEEKISSILLGGDRINTGRISAACHVMKVRTISLTGVGFPPGQINLELIYAVHARITLSKINFLKQEREGGAGGWSQ